MFSIHQMLMSNEVRFPLDHNSVVAITGASSGIGAALVLELAQRGVCLALCARRADRLAEVAQHARARGTRVRAASRCVG